MTTSCFVIAEAGVNHDGSLDQALRLVEAAAAAGADAIKFQTFRAGAVVTAGAARAEYQAANTGDAGSQLDMLGRLELPPEAFVRLAGAAHDAGLVFMSTAFDLESLDFLIRTTRVDRLKVPSGEITNGPYLLACARSGLPLVVSTGMATLDEVALALDVLAWGRLEERPPAGIEEVRGLCTRGRGRTALAGDVTLLHCTSEYPAPFEDVNLRAMDTLAAAFELPVGYSDHTAGITVPIAAAARGAAVIEKHFTLDRTLPGPDHRASLEPDELASMVRAIRDTEAALGRPEKAPAPSEEKNLAVVRRSLVAARPITAGETFTLDTLDAKRPAGGLAPMASWDLVGRRASRAYAVDEAIDIGELDR